MSNEQMHFFVLGTNDNTTSYKQHQHIFIVLGAKSFYVVIVGRKKSFLLLS